MYDVDAVLTKQFNVFDAYGVSEYLYLHNLTIDKRFRGFNFGFQMLHARLGFLFFFYIFSVNICFVFPNRSKDFCRESNIKVMHGIFTSDYSNRIGDELGFKLDLAIRYDYMNERHR